MIRIPGKIPISIHPLFWLFSGLIGFLYSRNIVGTLIWMGIIFISVLFHELGHALTALLFGRKPRIELVAMGGLTYHDGEKLKYWKQFFITLNGPLFGFLLFGFAYFLEGQISDPLFQRILINLQSVNLIWTIVNLLPVLPLDGGQLVRIGFEAIFGALGLRHALLFSSLVSGGVALTFFLYQSLLLGSIFFLLAFNSFDQWRKLKHLKAVDSRETLKSDWLLLKSI
jgi:stage IV sporulation protein FB